ARQVAHRERRLVRVGKSAGKGESFGELQAVGEHARDEMVLRLRRVARHLQDERLVHAAVDMRELDCEIVDRRAKRPDNLRRVTANIDAMSYLVGIDIGGT